MPDFLLRPRRYRPNDVWVFFPEPHRIGLIGTNYFAKDSPDPFLDLRSS